jgi:hypothetical protein
MRELNSNHRSYKVKFRGGSHVGGKQQGRKARKRGV